jgi:dienelactone hydrolase
VPTRLGYGESSGGMDPENSGGCSRKNYAPGFDAAATSALDVLRYARTQRFTDPTRTVILGQSFGGMSSIALAARRPEGVSAFINFAGGGGGDPDTHPFEPCQAHLLRELYADYGKTARTPSLWVYTENDRFFGGGLPQKWFSAFQQNGGAGEFQALPAFGANGHSLFGQGFEIWRPIVDAFLERQGFAIPRSVDAPPATDFARLEQVDKVPRLGREARERYQRFLKLDVPRAFAIGPRDAVKRAMDACRKFAATGCALYAVDDRVVWKEAP